MRSKHSSALVKAVGEGRRALFPPPSHQWPLPDQPLTITWEDSEGPLGSWGQNGRDILDDDDDDSDDEDEDDNDDSGKQ